MPIYTPQNTNKYYRVFDANGLEWKNVTMVNTDTGEIEQFIRDAEGLLCRGLDGNAAMERRTIPLPIQMVPIGDRWIEDDA